MRADLARQWPADNVLIETEQRKPVRVTGGAARTSPLYLAHRDGILHAGLAGYGRAVRGSGVPA